MGLGNLGPWDFSPWEIGTLGSVDSFMRKYSESPSETHSESNYRGEVVRMGVGAGYGWLFVGLDIA